MKNIFKSLIFAAIAATAFAACSESPEVLDENGHAKLVSLTISTDKPEIVDDTRTMVAEDGITPLWCPGDAIGVCVYAYGEYVSYEFTNDNTGAPSEKTTFSGYTAVGNMLYTYYPYGNISVNPVSCEAAVTIPDIQHPTPVSFDGAADILVGKPVEMTPATTKIEGLRFRRMGGFLKIVLKDQTSGNLLADEQVNTLSISADEQLVGQNSLDIINCRLDDAAGNYGMTVTAEYTSKTQYRIGDDKAATWFGVYPQTLAEGSTLVISAKTRGYEIHREITLPRDIEIKAGRITTLAVNIDEANISERTLYIDEIFPDPVFRQYVSDKIDADRDGILSKDEIWAVRNIDVSNNDDTTPTEGKIASLEGIQYFANLKTLLCSYNQLTTLDLSQNTALTNLSCRHNQLTTLDLSNNTELRDLSCYDNQLTTLDISGCTALTWLSCYNNQLTTLDLSNNTALTGLWCYNNQLTTLDVSNNTALGSLWCYSNQLTTLDLSNNTALTSLACGFNQLTTLDLSNNTALTYLDCSYNQLTTLDLSNNTALTYLDCSYNQLTTLDVSQNTALEYLGCGVNQLTTLDLSNNTALQHLECSSNPLTTLDLSKNTALKYLRCDNNQLTTLDVSKNTALTYLSCRYNQLTTLDVPKNTALTTLYCDYNQLIDLDLSKNTALKNLLCGYNRLTTLDLSNNTALDFLWCDNNQLTTLDVSGCSALRTLDCSYNQLATLDVSKTNLGNSTSYRPLDCAPMGTLTKLYLKKGWEIKGITTDRDSEYIPDHTKILFVDEDGNVEADDDIEQMFPDPVFRQYVLDNFDTDRDGKISTAEAEAVTLIGMEGLESMISTEGIQYFTNLKQLIIYYCPELSVLDLSQNTALEKLTCSLTKIESLDLSKNTALKTLDCYRDTKMTNIDISNCAELTTIDIYESLLESLDISRCAELTQLACGSNQLTSLDVSNNTELTYLSCYSNQLTSLDVSNNMALIFLDCTSNQLTTLDLSKNTALEDLSCGYNQLTTLDVSKTNIGNNTQPNHYPLSCAPMDTLEVLYLKEGWRIRGITPNRNSGFIPNHTEIIFVD